MVQQFPWVKFQSDEEFDVLQGIPEDEAGPSQGAEEVAQERESAPRGTGEEECRAARGVNPPLNSADLQVRIEFRLDPEQLPLSFQVGHAGRKVPVPHDVSIPRYDTHLLRHLVQHVNHNNPSWLVKPSHRRNWLRIITV